MSNQLPDNLAEDSAAALLLRIQHDKENRALAEAIPEWQAATRAAARARFLAAYQGLKDELATDPSGHPQRAELEAEIAKREAIMADLDRVPAIDRAGLSQAWEATLRRGDQSAKLGNCLIDGSNYRAWRSHRKYEDNSPAAKAIVDLLTRELRAAGIDVTRFGVR